MNTLTLFALPALLISFSASADDSGIRLQGMDPPKPRGIAVHEPKLQMPQPKKFNSEIMVINRELRKDPAARPLQWLKRNYEARGVMNKGEIECFKQQKTEFDKAMDDNKVRAALKEADVPRMTYNLFSNSNEKSAYIRWNQPRSHGAMGGNYLIVKFGNADGKCHFKTAEEIKLTALTAKDAKKNPDDYLPKRVDGEGSGEEQEYHAPAKVGFPDGSYGATPSPHMPAVIQPKQIEEGSATLGEPSIGGPTLIPVN